MKKLFFIGLSSLVLTIAMLLGTSFTSSLSAHASSITPAQTVKSTSTSQPAKQDSNTNNHGQKTLSALDYLKAHRSELVAAVAKDLKLSSDQLNRQLQGGKKVTDIARAQRVSEQQLQKDLKQDTTTLLNKGVSQGQVSKDEANKFAINFSKNINSIYTLLQSK
ncbi:hypothetical protein [Ktedonobacter racemifer]|uniref:Uncharacterized protein n=1 Tax=Ktedonobacter racemifer DSM 44963 TaxID=485913 RepID=D6TQD6_KTERA|nr:hypothetical protein [Ktedonobacter racemifer]EFH85784.1 hypothetical protein Krac_7023 [Ktedonobacter racemifer DSM 44963]